MEEMVCTGRRKGGGALLLGSLLVATGTFGFAGRAAAEPSLITYRAFGHADAMQLRLVDQQAPVFPGGEILAASPSTAEASVDSSGQSVGFASAPYPGATLSTLPGVYNGVRPPQMPEAPAYPWRVTSSYPAEQSSEVAQGPTAIKSTSNAHDTQAEARYGMVSGSPSAVDTTARAVAALDSATGTLRAEASSAMTGFSIGDSLKIGRVAGRAAVTTPPGKPATKTSSFEVGTFTVAGQTIGLTERGFVAGEQAQDFALEFVAGGFTFRYLPAVETATAIESAGLTIGFAENVPNRGLTQVIVTLGRVRAEAESQTFSDLGSVDIPAAPSSGETTLESQAPALPEPTVEAGAAADLPTGVVPALQPLVGTASSAPVAASAATSAVTASPTPAAADPAPAEVALRPVPRRMARPLTASLAEATRARFDGKGGQVYLVFLAAGAVIVVGALVFLRRFTAGVTATFTGPALRRS
jgi:hypothetical protein